MWRLYPRRVDWLDIEFEFDKPVYFRNWGWYSHSEFRDKLVILNEKPYFWWTSFYHRQHYLNYFICEMSYEQQNIKNSAAAKNFMVRTDSYDSEFPSFLSKGIFYSLLQDCRKPIGTNSTCVYLDPHGCYCVVLNNVCYVKQEGLIQMIYSNFFL
jgi:hypothetical protein